MDPPLPTKFFNADTQVALLEDDSKHLENYVVLLQSVTKSEASRPHLVQFWFLGRSLEQFHCLARSPTSCQDLWPQSPVLLGSSRGRLADRGSAGLGGSSEGSPCCRPSHGGAPAEC